MQVLRDGTLKPGAKRQLIKARAPTDGLAWRRRVRGAPRGLTPKHEGYCGERASDDVPPYYRLLEQ